LSGLEQTFTAREGELEGEGVGVGGEVKGIVTNLRTRTRGLKAVGGGLEGGGNGHGGLLLG
jgi:hypothetical protein